MNWRGTEFENDDGEDRHVPTHRQHPHGWENDQPVPIIQPGSDQSSDAPDDPRVDGFRACLEILNKASDPDVIGKMSLALEYELGFSPCKNLEELAKRMKCSEGRASQVVKAVREQIALILRAN